MAAGSTHLCEQVGVFTPKAVQRDTLCAGEVGYIISGIKELQAAKVGDTVVLIEARSPYSAPDSTMALPPEKQTNSSGRK